MKLTKDVEAAQCEFNRFRLCIFYFPFSQEILHSPTKGKIEYSSLSNNDRIVNLYRMRQLLDDTGAQPPSDVSVKLNLNSRWNRKSTSAE